MLDKSLPSREIIAGGEVAPQEWPGRNRTAMEKTQDAFRTIGEVAEELDLPQHVLRFWETKFTQIRPVKRAGGRRYYRPDDVQLLAAIRILLYSEGYTIKGVQRILKEQGARAVVAASQGAGRPGARAQAAAPTPKTSATEAVPAQVELSGYLAPLEPSVDDHGAAPPAGVESARPGVTFLSPQDRHRMEAIPRRTQRMRENAGPDAARIRSAAFFRCGVARRKSLVYKAGSRSVAQPG